MKVKKAKKWNMLSEQVTYKKWKCVIDEKPIT